MASLGSVPLLYDVTSVRLLSYGTFVPYLHSCCHAEAG